MPRRRTWGTTAAAAFLGLIVAVGCSTSEPVEASFCDHLAEIDGTGGALTELSLDDSEALAEATDAFRDASKTAPEGLSNDMDMIVSTFEQLQRHASNPDTVGVASQLRDQQEDLNEASARVTAHAETSCGITLGVS